MANMALDILSGKEINKKVTIPAELVIRKSTEINK